MTFTKFDRRGPKLVSERGRERVGVSERGREGEGGGYFTKRSIY